MGNVYHFTKCAHCNKAVEVGGEGHPEVMVHRGGNADEVIRRINAGEPMETIVPDFCMNCGGKMPCGCREPDPQFV